MNPELGQAVSSAPRALLLLTTRGAPLLAQRQRLGLLADRLGLAVMGERVFHRRRRGGLGEQLRALVLADAGVVLVERLAALGKSCDPLSPLLAAAEIRSMGVLLLSASPDESWLLEIGAALPAVGAWVESARREQRREQARAALSRARALGRALGRPRKVIDLVAARALLAELGSVERVASRLSVGASTLRRALRAGLPIEPPQSWSPTVLSGGAQ